ncbi:MAG TPA: hypothetical protein VHF89_05545 [Solirubrobacteraceae bacterium]|nr:hypothetical protein [Solirubrobacteraceae bacterium]
MRKALPIAVAGAQGTGCATAGATGDPVQDCVKSTTGVDVAEAHASAMRAAPHVDDGSVRFLTSAGKHIECTVEADLSRWGFVAYGTGVVMCQDVDALGQPRYRDTITPAAAVRIEVTRTFTAGGLPITYASRSAKSCSEPRVGSWFCATGAETENMDLAVFRARAEATISYPDAVRVAKGSSCYSTLGHAAVRCFAENKEVLGIDLDGEGQR